MVVFIVISLVISVLATIYLVKVAKRPGGPAKVCSISFVGAILSLMSFSPAIFLQMALTFVGSLICIAFKRNRHFVKPLVIAAPIISYACILYPSIAELRELAKLREKYPVESIAARLEYEHKGNALPKDTADAAPQLSFATAKQLDQFENRDSYNTRRRRLQMLHNHTTEEFIMAQGFGPMRMRAFTPTAITLSYADAGPISLELPHACVSPTPANDSGSASQEKEPAAGTMLPAKGLLESLHSDGRNDFLDEGQMGYVQDRNHVTGFQSHHFTKMPKASDESWRTSWRIFRLELIGILKYDKPKAYISKNLPRLAELGDAPTRDLDAFESAALNRLRTQEDVVIDETANRIRMVGSLRATKTCIECHEVNRGELLGALSYELVPLKTKPSPDQSNTAMTMEP